MVDIFEYHSKVVLAFVCLIFIQDSTNSAYNYDYISYKLRLAHEIIIFDRLMCQYWTVEFNIALAITNEIFFRDPSDFSTTRNCVKTPKYYITKLKKNIMLLSLKKLFAVQDFREVVPFQNHTEDKTAYVT